MGICYYLINRGKREAFDLDKGWVDLSEHLTGEPMKREDFDKAVLMCWCGWATLTPEEYEEQLTWPALGASRRDRELALAERYVLHSSGYYVRKHDGIAPYDFDADLAYAAKVAEKLWAFCERHAWQVSVINDGGDPPWWDEGGWMCVASRFDTTRVPHKLGWGA